VIQAPHPPASGITRADSIKKVLLIELSLNLLIATAKIVLGLTTRCMSILSDGIHSLSDGASNVIGLVGISIAAHPADEDHPYGHRKFETMASLAVSFALFFVAISILKESIVHFFNPEIPQVTALSFVVMGITLVVNIIVSLWERAQGKKLKSELLIADSWHTMTDVFVTLSIFVALIGITLGFNQLDSIVSFGIALFIIRIAFKILVSSSDVLSDKVMIPHEHIKKIVMGLPGVSDCHQIRSRGRQDDIRIDLHILVDPGMSVEKSHGIANLTEKALSEKFAGVTDVLVHIEPLHHDHTSTGV
jgi:cation diffusion facilitator family transporter